MSELKCKVQSRSSLVEGDEGSYLPNCQTNLVIAIHPPSLLFWHFINTAAYHFWQIQAFVSCRACHLLEMSTYWLIWLQGISCRRLIASRNIRANEFILIEDAVVIAPAPNSMPVCPICLKRIANDDNKCAKCEIPVCQDPECVQDPIHGPECR